MPGDHDLLVGRNDADVNPAFPGPDLRLREFVGFRVEFDAQPMQALADG